MTTTQGTEGVDIFDFSGLTPPTGSNAFFVDLLAGDDQFNGSAFNDVVDGGGGVDRLFGNGGDDILRGEAGADILVGGAGNDSLFGGTGSDTLAGGAGTDFLRGQTGDDIYVHQGAADGFDIIADDQSDSGVSGFGGGTLDRVIVAYDFNDLNFQLIGGDDLFIGSNADLAANGQFTNGVVIDNFFQGGNNLIEIIQTGDGHVEPLLDVLFA